MNGLERLEDDNIRVREALELAFRPYADPGFLFGVLSLMKADPAFLDFALEAESAKTTPTALLIPAVNPTYEAAKAIVAIHQFDRTYRPPEARRVEDFAYRSEVKKEALAMLTLRKFAPDLKNRDFFGEYLPYYYFSYVTANAYEKSLLALPEAKGAEKRRLRSFLIELTQDVKAIVVTSEIPTIPQSLKLLRALIEGFISFRVLAAHPEAIAAYEAFLGYVDFYDQNGYYGPEFEKAYAAVDKTIYRSKYAAYGWLDAIKAYALKKDKRYILREAADLASLQAAEEETLLNDYKFLCKFVHGAYSLEGYSADFLVSLAMEATLRLLLLLSVDYTRLTGNSGKLGGVDLPSWLSLLHQEVQKAEYEASPGSWRP